MQDTRIEWSRLYEGLDAAHTPRLFVPERYVEKRSSRLQQLAVQALLSSHMFPDTQFDVVWLGSKPTALLRAEMQPTGTFGHSFGYDVEGSDDCFLSDPSVIEQRFHHYNYSERIERALANGAGVFKPADLAPHN